MLGQFSPGSFYPGEAGQPGVLYTQAVAGSVTPTGSLTVIRIFLKTLVGSVTPVGIIPFRNISHVLVGFLTPTSIVNRVITRFVSGSSVPTGTVNKRLAKLLSGIVSSAGSVFTSFVYVQMNKVYIGGVLWLIEYDTLEVEDLLNEEPNQCTFQTRTPPTEGQAIAIVRGPSRIMEFAGHVLTVNMSVQELHANRLYDVTCQDYTWKFNRRLVTKRWTNVSATTIAQEILSGFTSGFTGTNIVAVLPTVAEFECVLETPSSAFGRLAAEIGGNYYIDYGNFDTGALPDVHFFITETMDAPTDFTATYPGADLTYSKDIAQIRTRVTGIGGGSSTLEDSAVAANSVPLQDATMFESAGGQFLSGPNIGTYTSKHNGGIASSVAGNISSPGGSAPTAALTPNVVGNLVGPKQYKIAFGASQGETIPGAASNSVTGVAFLPPTGASVAATSSVVGKLIGIYLYVLTYVTNLGETSAGASFGRTAVAVAAPGALTVGVGSSVGRLIGLRNYRVTFKTPYGETEGGTIAGRTGVAVTAPVAPTVSLVSTTMGNLIGIYGYKVVLGSEFGESAGSTVGSRTAAAQSAPAAPTRTGTNAGPLIGAYKWKIAFVATNLRETLGSNGDTTMNAVTAAISSVTGTAGTTLHYRVSFFHPIYGETAWSSVSSVGSGSHTVTVSGLPSGCGWKLYSTGLGFASTDPYYHVATLPPGVTAYTHLSASGPESQSPAATLGQYCALSSVPTGPTGTIARNIYRTKAGGTEYYLSGTLGDNISTTYNDTVPDDALTSGAPIQNLNGEQHSITSIGTGPTGTTYRDIYRTESGGSVYYYLRRIFDNITTSFTDNAADTELDKGKAVPSVATLGDQHSLTFIPLGPTGTLSRVIYCTTLGGSLYKKLVEIGDNSTTSFVDNVADTALGQESAPIVSSAGGESHSLSSIPTGPTGTLARNIYRTVAGGSSFQFVGQLTDNVATTFVDNKSDGEIGDYVPLINTAGANQVTLTFIPLGGAGVTQRVIYRLDVDGVYKYVDTLNDNTTTTYQDNVPDDSLGRPALTVGTIGAMQGDTTLILLSTTGLPTSGWIEADGQLIRYTGVTGVTLTGIPATGVGAILSPIQGGSTALSLPFLSGVTGIGWPMDRGVEVRLYVQRNDAPAQATLAALEGGDGIHEYQIEDNTIITVAGLNAACDAELATYKNSLKSTTFNSRDAKLRSGKTVVVNRSPISGSFLLQRVISNQFNRSRGILPLRTVDGAPVRLSFQTVLKRTKANENKTQ